MAQLKGVEYLVARTAILIKANRDYRKMILVTDPFPSEVVTYKNGLTITELSNTCTYMDTHIPV